MKDFHFRCSIVIFRLKEKGFSEKSIQSYRKVYAAIGDYVNEKGVIYSPELGEKMLLINDDAFFQVSGKALRAACIRKLNDVYKHGDIKESVLSPRHEYGNIVLVEPFETAAIGFMESVKDTFSPVQQGNVNRRIRLFWKFVQFHGICSLDGVSYEIITAYHNELSHLKTASRIVEESSIHQILHYLSDQGMLDPGRYLHMYLLEKGHPMTLEAFSLEERQEIERYRLDSMCFPANMFLQSGQELIQKYQLAGYVPDSYKDAERTILYFYLFLDMNGLGYLPEIASIWLNSNVVKQVITGSSWKAARRVLHVFCDMLSEGEVCFQKVYRKGISGLEELPDWCKEPLMDFADLRKKEKLEESTVKNDIYSILRFLRFILQQKIQSFRDISGSTIIEFNLMDRHGSPEGKNACNIRIRRFLKYLGREGYLASPGLYMSIAPAAEPVETIVTIFTDDEVQTIRDYVGSATTDLEIRDSAIILLGCDMGMRGCDIVGLRLQDIDWKKQCIRIRQDKTDKDAVLAMPTAVGNAVFRYLRDARHKGVASDHVFISIDAPYHPIKRAVCYETLHRVLPGRKVHGSGFHATRKTFSTNRLRNGVSPTMIADAMGQAGIDSLTPYLFLDDERMSLCPITLEELSIPVEGGIR